MARSDPTLKAPRICTTPGDCGPPLKIVAFLSQWGFLQVKIKEGVPPWWKRGDRTVPWDEAPAALAEDLARQCSALETENARLKAVTPKPGIVSSEFLLNAGGVLVIGVMAAQGQLADLAEKLGPTAGAILNIVITVIVAGAGGTYMAKRKSDKTAAADAKKQISQEPLK